MTVAQKCYAKWTAFKSRHPEVSHVMFGHDEVDGSYEIMVFDQQDRLMFHETAEILDRYIYDNGDEDSEYTVRHKNGRESRSKTMFANAQG